MTDLKPLTVRQLIALLDALPEEDKDLEVWAPDCYEEWPVERPTKGKFYGDDVIWLWENPYD